MKWKYQGDLELHKRTAFKWFILRPGGLLDTPGTGKVDIGITHLSERIPVSGLPETTCSNCMFDFVEILLMEPNPFSITSATMSQKSSRLSLKIPPVLSVRQD